MSVCFPVKERCSGHGKLWRFSRSLFLLITIAALGYSGWIYFAAYWHERRESAAFDRAREAPPGETVQPIERFTAKLTIPRLRLTTIVEEGVDEKTLQRSAGHIPDTALPGRPGNVGIAAHRDTFFRRLRGIQERDRIVLSTLRTDYNYEVISTSIVNPDDVSVLAPSQGQKTLTLVTCYPFNFIGHAPKRFIVHARQIDQNVPSKATSLVVRNPHEAAQTGAGVQMIAAQEVEMAKPQSDTLLVRQMAMQANATTQTARTEADGTRAQIYAKHATRQRAEVNAAARWRSAPDEVQIAEANRLSAADQSSRNQQDQATGQKTELRVQLLGQLKGILSVRDTPRGLMATVRDVDFSGPVLRRIAADQVARIAAIVAAYPELRVEVDGHTDSAGTEALSGKRAEAVREVLLGNGLPANAVVARGFGHTRFLVSNANRTGRLENRRVEIVISGDPIGNLATWDRSYTLTLR